MEEGREGGDARHDLISHLVLFCRSLREHGLLVGPGETADAARSLALVNILDRDRVYWAFRTILVSRVEEVDAFDRCFSRFWRLALPSLPPLSRNKGGQGKGIGAGGLVGKTPGDEGYDQAHLQEAQIIRTGASPVEVVARRDLTVFQGSDLAQMYEIADRIKRALPSRPGRRRRRHHRKGTPDLRGALRLNLAHGGDILTIPRRRRVRRIPRLLVLLDVSGSMDQHTELLLQLVYCLGARSARVESFVFSTSLTRITRELKTPSFFPALRRVSGLVSHWSGGTRIGDCLETLNTEYAHILDRNTSVLLFSDGWETGDPNHLARELARLRKRVKQLVWLNPLLGTPDYAPLTLGLQAAAPHVDLFASALDMAQLKRLPGLLLQTKNYPRRFQPPGVVSINSVT